MNYRFTKLPLLLLDIGLLSSDVGLEYYLQTRNVTYDFSVTAAALGAIAYVVGWLSPVLLISLIWVAWTLIRQRKLPDRLFGNFLLIALPFLLLSMVGLLQSLVKGGPV